MQDAPSPSLHTFVVLVYKQSPHLEECLRSLKAQTQKSSIILATSTPSEFVSEIGRRLDLPLKVNPIQSGIGADWSFAYSLAQTPYVTLAHQDDIYLPQYTEQCLTLADSNSDLLFLFTDYMERAGDRLVDQNLLLMVKRVLIQLAFWGSHVIRTQTQKRLLFTFGTPVPCPSVCYHKARIGELKFSTQYQFVLDWDACLSIAMREGAIGRLSDRLLVHRIHTESATFAATSSELRHNEEMEMFRRVWPKFAANFIGWVYRLSHYSPVYSEKIPKT